MEEIELEETFEDEDSETAPFFETLAGKAVEAVVVSAASLCGLLAAAVVSSTIAHKIEERRARKLAEKEAREHETTVTGDVIN